MRLRLLLCIGLIAMLLSACGGGGGGGTSSSGGGGGGSTLTISAQPGAVTVYETQSANFSVSASSASGLIYQWRKNGANITGANAATYTTPATTLADSGAVFSVVVTDSVGGSVESASATLTVQAAAPSITTQPTAQSATSGQSVTWTVSAIGMPSLNYQWRKNGTAISGATSSSYTSVVTLGDNNSQYSVVVSNSAGSVTSSAASLSVQAANLNHLVISEVGVCYYTNVDCWFEVYNPTAAAIDLSTHSVKSTSFNGSAVGTTTFTLPSVSVPADGYVVVTGNNSNAAQRGSQVVRLRSGSTVPYWSTDGFIELLSAGVTKDFVRFGTSSQTPVTTSEWSGASVAALPSSASDYGKSIVRLYPSTANVDTNTASDWTAVAWATPGGRNDVPANAVDADGDGIPDSAEVPGGTFAGLDLYAMGARTGQLDIFIEVDRMTSADAGVIPRSESLQKVVDAFAAQSIAVHFDAGSAFSSSFSTTSFNLGQGSNVVPYEQCVTLDQTTCTSNTSSRRSVYDWKDEYMDVRRRSIFHYVLFGNSQLANGASGSSGRAELPGNDLIVTMGNWGFSTTAGSALNQLINMQASTLMHELGHNLGLHHGGNVDTNYKPNYWSVMNYMYQLNGLAADPTASTAYQRWRKEKGDFTPLLCSLVNSPCGDPSQFIMSYSNGSSSALNESNLLESANIGRGSSNGGFADWNMDGGLTGTAQSKDLNGDSSFGTLTDYNDWSNLVLPFVRYYSANTGVMLNSNRSTAVSNPITDDRQPVAEETPPPASFFLELRRVR